MTVDGRSCVSCDTLILMDTLIHADIFFFVTTIVVIFIGILLVIILAYIATIVADIKKISALVRKESAEIALDIKDIRNEIRDDIMSGASSATKIFSIINTFRKFSGKRKRKNAAKNAREEKESDE